MEPIADPVAPPRRRGGRWRVFAGVGLILTAVVLMVLRAREDSVVYYVTVSELLARDAAAGLTGLRVTGKVVPGTIEREGRTLAFAVTDGAAAVPVIYAGAVPETFSEASEVVVEGAYVPGGSFEATGLLTKCPSKYEAEAQAGHQHPDSVVVEGR